MTAETPDAAVVVPNRKSILDLTAAEALAFLLKPESYCSCNVGQPFRTVRPKRSLQEAQGSQLRNRERGAEANESATSLTHPHAKLK